MTLDHHSEVVVALFTFDLDVLVFLAACGGDGDEPVAARGADHHDRGADDHDYGGADYRGDSTADYGR